MKSGLTRVIAKSPLFADKLWIGERERGDGKKAKKKNQVLASGKKIPRIVGMKGA